jgi:hypothetical protein
VLIVLHSLIYVSAASQALSLSDIDRLLERAQQRNSRHGLTGMLLYDGDAFMQYIEGPAEGLGRIYPGIRASSLHERVIELVRGTLERREFPEFSMAFRSVSAFGLSDPSLQSDWLMRAPDPAAPPLSTARLYLRNFWWRHRGQSAY